MSKKIKFHSGFTLIEILFSIILLSIILLLAAPNVKHFIHQQMADDTAYRVLNILQYARSAAIQKDQPVILCGASKHNHCADNWGHDWLLTNVDHTVLHVFQNVLRKGRMQVRVFGNAHAIQFAPTGLSAQNSTFSYSIQDALKWRIIVNKSGRARIHYTQ